MVSPFSNVDKRLSVLTLHQVLDKLRVADQQSSQWLLTLIDNRDSPHSLVIIGATSVSSRRIVDFLLKSPFSGMHALRSWFFLLFHGCGYMSAVSE